MAQTIELRSNGGAVKIAAKRMLRFAQRRLPGNFYDRAFPVAHEVYRAALRTAYGRNVVAGLVSGDTDRLLRSHLVLRVMPYSLVGASGLEATYQAATDAVVRRLPGAFVECGVAQGGSGALMALVADTYRDDRAVWLFDSYEGLPPPSEEDFGNDAHETGTHIRELPPGSCLGTYEEVEHLLFHTFRLNRDRIEMVKGWFENTLPVHGPAVGPIAILRIDADWYDSVRTCLTTLYDQVVSTGHVIIDDYGTCFGARKAVDELLAERGLNVRLLPDGRGGVQFQKP